MARMTRELPDEANNQRTLLLIYPAVSASSASSLLIPYHELSLTRRPGPEVRMLMVRLPNNARASACR